MLKKFYRAPALTRWNIIEKEVVDEAIFRTIKPRNRLVLELMARGLAWLLVCRCAARCCLRPRGVGSVLIRIALTTWPAPYWKGSAHSQTEFVLGAMRQIQGGPRPIRLHKNESP